MKLAIILAALTVAAYVALVLGGGIHRGPRDGDL